MSIVVYWLDADVSGHRAFTDGELLAALKFAEFQRTAGMRHVSLSSELAEQVGKPGVSAVEEGKTPDGHAYDWSKKHRGHPGL